MSKPTDMRVALNAWARLVRFNIAYGLDGDHAKEEAIALFRVARCVSPDQEEDRWRHR